MHVKAKIPSVTNPMMVMGYRCLCSGGYQGNPYLPDGCHGMIFKNIYATLSSNGPQACYWVVGKK